MDTICATLKDYFEDYQFLKPKNFKMVIEEAQVFTGCFVQSFGSGPGLPDSIGFMDPSPVLESESESRSETAKAYMPRE
jgi:hypothetical protein